MTGGDLLIRVLGSWGRRGGRWAGDSFDRYPAPEDLTGRYLPLVDQVKTANEKRSPGPIYERTVARRHVASP